MGRKIEIKKIQEITKRQVTFSKRRSSLLKKAEEIAICCDVDVLFVALSPADRLSKFCSQKRIEDVLQRYLKLPIERRLAHVNGVQEKVNKLKQLSHIRGDVSKLHFLDKQIENFELHIKKSTLELQIVDANIRDYEPGQEQEPSLHQLNWCERNLQLSLQKVMARKMELEKQAKMDAHIAAQQTAPQQFDTNNLINLYSSSVQGSLFQNWMDKGKRVANSSSNYTYTSPFSQQQNMIVDVQQNPAQIFRKPHSQQQNMVVDVQQNPTQLYGQSHAQVNFGESGDNSLLSFWQNICASTRPISSPLVTTGAQVNNPSQLGLEYANSTVNNNFTNPSQLGLENVLSNWNDNFNDNNNNNNHIVQQNNHSLVQTIAIAPNDNGVNCSTEKNTMGSNEHFVENTMEKDPWEWDDAFFDEAFNGDYF